MAGRSGSCMQENTFRRHSTASVVGWKIIPMLNKKNTYSMGRKKEEIRAKDLNQDPEKLFKELIELIDYKGVDKLRYQHDVVKRYCIITVMHENYPSLSLADLGYLFKKDHATAYYGMKTVFREIVLYKNGIYQQTYEFLSSYVKRYSQLNANFKGLEEEGLVALNTEL
jgi:hypothetical protein